MPHNLAHLLYELRRKSGNRDFDSEESITVIRQIALSLGLGIVTQTQARGNIRTAAQFTRTNSEQLEIVDNASLSIGGTDYCLAFWSRLDTRTANHTAVAKWGAGGNEYRVRVGSGNTYTWSTAGINLTSNIGNIELDEWKFGVFQFDSGGFRVGTSFNNSVMAWVGASTTPADGTAKFIVGNSDGASDYWDGKIAMLGMWKKNLTALEISSLFNGGKGLLHVGLSGSLLTSLEGYWNLNEASGIRLDREGNNGLFDINTVTQSLTKQYFAGRNTVRRNYCTNPSFEHDLTNWVATNTSDGKSSRFVAAGNEGLKIVSNPTLQTGDINFYFSVFMRLDFKIHDHTIASKWLTTGDHREWRLFFDVSEDRFRFEVSATGTSSITNVDADSLGSPVVNTNYFIEVWHDKDADTINIRVNNGTTDSVAHTTGLTAKDGAFFLGDDDSATPNGLHGRLSSAMFSKRRISPAESTFLYNSDHSRPYQALGLIDDGSNLKTNLVSFWNLSEASGTRIDSHGSNNLTDINTVTQTIGLDFYLANARDEAQSNYGQNSLKLEMVNSSASGEIISQAFTHTGPVANDVWSISISVRIALLTLAKFTLRLEYLDSGSSVLATHNVDSTAVSTTWATVKNENRTAPASTDKIRATLILQSTASLAFGAIHCDGLLIEKVAALGNYFDGDSQDCFWEGTIHSSENINDVDGDAMIAGFFHTST